MKKKNVALIGASGKMGREISSLLSKSQELRPALGVLRGGEAPEFKRTTTKLARKEFSEIDVIIDFSSIEIFSEVVDLAVSIGCPLISGVTGIGATEEKELKQAAKRIPILWAPNMSLGIATLTEALRSLKSVSHFDFQVEEFHHIRKKDKPSGTAIHLQKKLEEAVGKELPSPVAIRGGGIFGVHKVYAMSDSEVLVFEHSALNRRVFAEGAVAAASWILNRKKGIYQMRDVLGFAGAT